ncbi:MAG TPA: hypothetical protein VGQ62_13035 [Chloroflexota bacterium]|nr:hypothetical protein [Chloroflexota bacterium]
MTQHNLDLRDCPTAYECRDRLPELASWMSDEALKQLPIWKSDRLEPNREYYDLLNPDRGVFVAVGDERPVRHSFVERNQVPEQVWAQLVTWRQMISADQAVAIDDTVAELGIGREISASGQARTLPPL